jgi:heme/copper-type cytochrome/quinol oxidase subunit 3
MSMDVPYLIHERQDTGLFNSKMGIWLFLASEIMLFGALFSCYVLLRTGSSSWPLGSSILNVPIGTFNTVVLITSSITMVFAWVALKERNLARFKMFLGITILLAFTFLGVKTFEYSEKFHHHLFPATNTYMAIYFTMTGLHAIHVIGGIIVNSYLLGPGSKLWLTRPDQFTNRIEIAA